MYWRGKPTYSQQRVFARKSTVSGSHDIVDPGAMSTLK